MDVKSAWEGIVDRKEDHENMAWGVKKDKSGNIGLKFAWGLDGWILSFSVSPFLGFQYWKCAENYESHPVERMKLMAHGCTNGQ